ncbi:SET and MYND domain-containing protein 4 isoform X2 [Orussus abietinus]|uniref:SET and MYND domain-containing protein 4 isoform X2 n=1 Tax=Orussus abietinus TaxID=222816 RepID=UPI0006260186|nr:SET and MYND domain-containing protein 4 isoform X2 [Orussus abietinus]
MNDGDYEITQWQMLLDVLRSNYGTKCALLDIAARKKSEKDVMSYLFKKADFRHILSLWLEERQNSNKTKSTEKAEHLKKKGNEEFQKKDYRSSILSYTNSARFAPWKSKIAAVAIANRSASLFYLGLYEECLKDIELAMELEYPLNLRHKLLLREAQCHLKGKRRKLAKKALKKAREIIASSETLSLSKKDCIEKEISVLSLEALEINNSLEDEVSPLSPDDEKPKFPFEKNPSFPSASVALARRYSTDRGRYVTAERTIKKGEHLFVEEPFAFVLLDSSKSDGICGNCCRKYGYRPIPCISCPEDLYCSLKCSKEAFLRYHRFECPGSQMGLYQQIGIAHLALRVLLTCSFTTDKEKFNEVQCLVTNINDKPPEDLLMYGITSLMLTLYLRTYTDFFTNVNLKLCFADKFSCSGTSEVDKFQHDVINFDDNFSVTDQELYVSTLLLRYILQLICNGHAITKLNLTAFSNDTIASETQERIATGIYTSASMMNHSCDPNIVHSFHGRFLIVKAARDISVGGEVFNCYGPHFRRMPTSERRNHLKLQYHFLCKCEPCTDPKLQNFLELFKAFICPKCKGPIYKIQETTYWCLNCQNKYAIDYTRDINHADEIFRASQISIERSQHFEALEQLQECLNIRRNILYPLNEDITITTDTIGKVYAMLAIEVLDRNIKSIEIRFGCDSIEVANELNKLTDIYIQCLRQEENIKKKKHTIGKIQKLLDRTEEIISSSYGPWHESLKDVVNKRLELYAAQEELK